MHRVTAAMVVVVALAAPGWQGVGMAAARPPVVATPGVTWDRRTPAEVGLSPAKLDALRDRVRGRGCVIRSGYLVYTWGDQTKSADVASAFKPVLSTLLLLAIQEGKLKSVEERVADSEPRLKALNGGKDGAITWRHLASQTSGYGLAHEPGKSYSYNDYALALYYDVLTQKVFRDSGTNILKARLSEPLGFQDHVSFEAFGPRDRPGRLALSVRDFARFGLLYLRGGRWKDRQIIRPDLIRLAVGSPVPTTMPVGKVKDAAMLPGQRSIGGSKSITPVGPGYYSFNWWLNRNDREGRRLFEDAPADAYVASGHGGQRMLWVIPSLDMVVCWNDSPLADHDTSPGNPKSRINEAARLIRESVLDRFAPCTRVSIATGKWQLNGRVTYPRSKAEGLLMNVRVVNAVFEDRKRPDFDPEANTDAFIGKVPDYAAHGVRAFTVCLQGGSPGYEGALNSAFNRDGSLRRHYLDRVRRVIEACDRHGVVVILGCFYQRQDQVLQDEDAVRAGVVNVAKWVRARGYTNVLLEITNEFGHAGYDHRLLRTPEGQVELIRLAKKAAPGLLVSTSGLGDGKLPAAVADGSDYLLIHFNNQKTKDVGPDRALKKFGKPIVCNEDARSGAAAVQAGARSIEAGVSYGLMLESRNQKYPFKFDGAADDRPFYSWLAGITRP